MADWGGLAKKYGVDADKQGSSDKKASSSSQHAAHTGADAIDKAKRDVLSATALADRVKASFKEDGDFGGGSVGDSVAGKLGSCASDLGLEQAQTATQSISMGPGGSSSSSDDDEE
jgi:hypothetical protein